MQHNEMKIIRFKAIQNKLGGISRSTIDRWEKEKNFPNRIHLGKNSIGWNLEEVEKWISNRQ